MMEATQVRRFPWLTLGAAASVIAFALLILWYRATLVPDTRFQTAIGEHATVSLPDGSSLELNSNSLALVDYSAAARIIRLERGEAYFEVKHDTARPFWVVAGRSWVRAVGTAFNVYVRPSDVQVTVSEGTVKVATVRGSGEGPSDRALQAIPASVVTAGEQVRVRGADAHLRLLAPAELTRSVAWRSGTLNFEHQSLDQVVEELSRYTTVKVVIDDPSLRELPVGGTFDANAQGMEALLVMLEQGFGFKVKREGHDRASIERPDATPGPR
jgi:transmembrane sensor